MQLITWKSLFFSFSQRTSIIQHQSSIDILNKIIVPSGKILLKFNFCFFFYSSYFFLALRIKNDDKRIHRSKMILTFPRWSKRKRIRFPADAFHSLSLTRFFSKAQIYIQNNSSRCFVFLRLKIQTGVEFCYFKLENDRFDRNRK